MMEMGASSRRDGFVMCILRPWSEAGGPKADMAQPRVSRRPRGDEGLLPTSLTHPGKAWGCCLRVAAFLGLWWAGARVFKQLLCVSLFFGGV